MRRLHQALDHIRDYQNQYTFSGPVAEIHAAVGIRRGQSYFKWITNGVFNRLAMQGHLRMTAKYVHDPRLLMQSYDPAQWIFEV